MHWVEQDQKSTQGKILSTTRKKIFKKLTSKILITMNKLLFQRFPDIGLLILRIGVGSMLFLNHGFDKIIGGPEKWAGVGQTGMGSLGIDIFPAFFGFMAAFSESVGSILILLGLFFQPAAFFLFCTMAVGVLFHITSGIGSPELAMAYGLISLTLFFAGPGKFSLDNKFFSTD